MTGESAPQGPAFPEMRFSSLLPLPRQERWVPTMPLSPDNPSFGALVAALQSLPIGAPGAWRLYGPTSDGAYVRVWRRTPDDYAVVLDRGPTGCDSLALAPTPVTEAAARVQAYALLPPVLQAAGRSPRDIPWEAWAWRYTDAALVARWVAAGITDADGASMGTYLHLMPEDIPPVAPPGHWLDQLHALAVAHADGAAAR